MRFRAGGATQRQCHRGAGHPPARPITSPEPASRSMHAVHKCSAQHVQPVQTCMVIVFELFIGREVRHGSRDGRPVPQHHPRFKPIFPGTHMCSESSREPRRPSSQKSTVRESAKVRFGIRCRAQRLVLVGLSSVTSLGPLSRSPWCPHILIWCLHTLLRWGMALW